MNFDRSRAPETKRTLPQPVDGVLLFGRALKASSLDSRERAVLGVGMLYQFDFKTWRGFMSQEKVASNCGLGVRTVHDSIGMMKKLGVLTVLKRGCGRSGTSSEYQLHLDVLAGERIPAGIAGIPDEIPANGDGNTGKPRHKYRQTTTEIPAPFADPQCTQSHIQTPITTGEVGASIPPAVPLGGGDGGGVSLLAVASEKTPERGHSPQESERLLVAFGVSKGKARALAVVYPPAVVEAGIAWIQAHGSDATSPPGLLVRRLEDGTAEEYRRTLDRKGVQREGEDQRNAEKASLSRMVDLIRKLRAAVESDLSTEAERVAFHRDLALIRRAWPDPIQAALSGVLSEADLADPSADPRDLFDRLARAAEAAIGARADPLSICDSLSI